MKTYEDIQKANEESKSTPIKGKNYIEVNERIKAFRKVYPEGFIINEMISNVDGVCVFKSEVGFYSDDGQKRILGTGTAFEKESGSFINKTSYIENCETSACGRALGMCGFGINASIASAEEVANAILNQNTKVEYITPKEQEVLKNLCGLKGLNIKDTFPGGIDKLTPVQYTDALKRIKALKDKA